MEDQKFDFRWGIPALDSGFTTIPNFMIKNYSKLGITPAQFTLVIHLASFHYNSPHGQSSPSIGTLAKDMGVSERYLQELTRSLEDEGYLKITARPGKTNVYSLQPLTLACLELDKGGEPEFTPEPEITPPMNPSSPLGVNPSSPKEQEQEEKEQQQQDVVVVSYKTGRKAGEGLEGLGISKDAAGDLVRKHGMERVGVVIDHLKQSLGDIKNPSGWVIAALEADYDFPELASAVAAKERLRWLRASCVFQRNPVMGECPSEECGKPVYPWCKGCERACPIAP